MLHVTFLAHSGFLVEDGKRCYVFDYYKDPNNIVWQLAKRGRELWFFVSHTHGDHFNPSITEFDGPQTRYICHQDVPLEGKVKKCITMRPGQDALLDDVGIHMYGSTDEGGYFYVKTNTANIDFTLSSMQETLTGGIGLVIRQKTMRMQSVWLGVSSRN